MTTMGNNVNVDNTKATTSSTEEEFQVPTEELLPPDILDSDPHLDPVDDTNNTILPVLSPTVQQEQQQVVENGLEALVAAHDGLDDDGQRAVVTTAATPPPPKDGIENSVAATAPPKTKPTDAATSFEIGTLVRKVRIFLLIHHK